MRVGFVVEGSHVYNSRTKVDLLQRLWRVELPRAIGCGTPDHVFGMSKGSVSAMRLQKMPLKPTTSIAEPLDEILERHRLTHGIDCFVIVWDLLPPWDKAAPLCRWNETLSLYEGLSLSSHLDATFRKYAADRFQEMSQRKRPNFRPRVPKAIQGSVLAVCVEPLFESVFMDELAMRKCLGVRGIRTQGWPSGWSRGNARASRVVAEAIDAARDAAPTKPVFRRIRQGYETLKTEWAIHLFQSRLFDNELKGHPLGTRLNEVVPKNRTWT